MIFGRFTERSQIVLIEAQQESQKFCPYFLATSKLSSNNLLVLGVNSISEDNISSSPNPKYSSVRLLTFSIVNPLVVNNWLAYPFSFNIPKRTCSVPIYPCLNQRKEGITLLCILFN